MTLSYEESRKRQRIAAQKSMQLLYRVRRGEACAAYGDKCRVCGNPDQDTLMIVPKNGYRWTESRTGKKLRAGHEKLRWLENNGFPDDFTLVCSRRCWTRLQGMQLLE